MFTFLRNLLEYIRLINTDVGILSYSGKELMFTNKRVYRKTDIRSVQKPSNVCFYFQIRIYSAKHRVT